MKQTRILNAAGKPIVLNDQEERMAEHNQRVVNALGYEVDITSLTAISKKVSEQKFFEVLPADYVPVRVGDGAWSSSILTYRSFQLADDFATGIINTGGNNGRLATADAGVDSLTVAVRNWAKEIGWTLMDLQLAARSGNWDLVTAKEQSRKRNWDLGIQKVAFLGMDSNSLGLLNQAGVTNNTSVVTKAISGMSTTELKAFTKAVIETYRSNCNRTAWPTHFVIPETDYNGLASTVSPDFPIKSVLQLLEETFQTITRNKSFKILPLAYGDSESNSLGVQRYVLLNYDEQSVRMDIPVDYTNTLANSINNFSFQNVGYGQFTGVLAYRPLELLYFSYTP